MNNVTTNPDLSIEEYIYQLAGYVATCTEMILSPRGNIRYAALRFIEILNRLIDLHNYSDCIQEDNFLLDIQKRLWELERERDKMDKLRNQMQNIISDFAEEAIKRLE
jgi:hypothetical protein